MDDLSFEEFEIEYKYLKAVIEGGLERKPENILIYATSNRRHLVRERAGDKLEVGADDDIHSSDTVQEKLLLYIVFGVRIYFVHQTERNSILSLRRWHSVTELQCRRMSFFWRLANGKFLMVGLQDVLHSSLLIIFLERKKHRKRSNNA